LACSARSIGTRRTDQGIGHPRAHRPKIHRDVAEPGLELLARRCGDTELTKRVSGALNCDIRDSAGLLSRPVIPCYQQTCNPWTRCPHGQEHAFLRLSELRRGL
jgi:hypothetical protein